MVADLVRDKDVWETQAELDSSRRAVVKTAAETFILLRFLVWLLLQRSSRPA